MSDEIKSPSIADELGLILDISPLKQNDSEKLKQDFINAVLWQIHVMYNQFFTFQTIGKEKQQFIDADANTKLKASDPYAAKNIAKAISYFDNLKFKNNNHDKLTGICNILIETAEVLHTIQPTNDFIKTAIAREKAKFTALEHHYQVNKLKKDMKDVIFPVSVGGGASIIVAGTLISAGVLFAFVNPMIGFGIMALGFTIMCAGLYFCKVIDIGLDTGTNNHGNIRDMKSSIGIMYNAIFTANNLPKTSKVDMQNLSSPKKPFSQRL